MAQVEAPQSAAARAGSGFGETERKDAWWVGPLLTGLALGGFVVYATVRALSNSNYLVGPSNEAELTSISFKDHSHLLSPFYSPLLKFPWLPAWLSPAVLILWAPGGFRVTCYYYRKAYYRAFFLDPAGCAVGEPGSHCGFTRGRAYKGETKLLLFQNLHRYFMYLALIFLVILSVDVVLSCIWPKADGGREFGVSVGTLILAANVLLLSLYTFSCHSLRHLVGGRVDCFSRAAFGKARYEMWKCTSTLNRNHMLYAWLSLFMVAFADFYVWMVASERITDFRFF